MQLLTTEVPWPRRLVPGVAGGLPPTKIRAPSWVRHGHCKPAAPCACTSTSPCKGVCEGLLSTPARCTIRDRKLAPPPGFNLSGMFRQTHSHEHASVCQAGYGRYAMHDDIDAGLVEAGCWAQKLSFEMDAILHKVGTNDSMSGLLESSAVCWDWAELAFTRPSSRHVQAFQDACKRLVPCMEQTMYPLGSEFNQVSRRWPSMDELCAQYMILARRVREAMTAGRSPGRASMIPSDVAKDAGCTSGFNATV